MIIKNDKVYDALKWLYFVLPSIGTAYARLAQVWGLPFPEEVSKTVMIICALMGALLGISNAAYYKTNAQLGHTDFVEELEPLEQEEGEG